MALPIPGQGGNKQTPPTKGLPVPNAADKKSSGLPTSPPVKKKPSGLPVPDNKQPTSPPEPKAEEKLEEGWAIDPRTGVKYRQLHANNEDAVKAFKKEGGKGLSLEQMRRYTEDVDFDIDNLNSMADDFLGHLRIAPSKEEIAEMRKQREKRMKAATANQKRLAMEAGEDE